MRVCIIDPAEKKLEYKEVDEERVARAAGIDSVDHGVVQRGPDINFGIFVPELGLYSKEPLYFAMGRTLYHGRAVLYAFDEQGETQPIPRRYHPIPIWLGSIEAVEQAIRDGVVDRPYIAIDDTVLWRWPDKRRS